jgi:hypothetical protein
MEIIYPHWLQQYEPFYRRPSQMVHALRVLCVKTLSVLVAGIMSYSKAAARSVLIAEHHLVAHDLINH